MARRVLLGLLLAVGCSPCLHADVSLTLGWNEYGSQGVAGYRVYYGTASRQYTDSVDAGLQFSCTITGLVENTTYYFAVAALDSQGNESAYSDEIRYPPDVQVQALIYPDGARLTWDETIDSGVVGYNLYYGTSSGDYSNEVQTGLGFINTEPGFVCTLSGLAAGTTYYFAVRPYDIYGIEGDFSPEQTYTTMLRLPTAQVVLNVEPEGQELLWYVWPGTNVASYIVQYGAASGDYTNSIDTGPGFVGTVTGLVEGVTYYFAVAPLTDNGQLGFASDEFSYTVPVLNLAVHGTVLPDGTDAFDITGQAGKTYAVMGSPDGLRWTVLGIGTIGLAGTLELLEPAGTLDTYPVYTLLEVSHSNAGPAPRPGLASDGTVTLSATGQVGQPYAVLATDTLAPAVWTYLGTAYPDSSGNLSFTDTGSVNLPARYYQLQNVSYTPQSPKLQIAQDPSTGTVLTGSGQPNQTYNIFAAPDLASWSLLGSVTSDTTGEFEFTDFGSAFAPCRFYLAAQVPN